MLLGLSAAYVSVAIQGWPTQLMTVTCCTGTSRQALDCRPTGSCEGPQVYSDTIQFQAVQCQQ